MTILKKVFGIISYFPDNDSEYHIKTRKERSRRFRELLFKLEEYWPDVDIMVIAQNWQEFELPKIRNKIITFHYDKLGILDARKELRKKFLETDYDYLIMLDDDGMITTTDPSLYMREIDDHPGGVGVIRHSQCPLMLLAISKEIYSQVDMPNIDPEKGEGFEDDLFVATCFAKFPKASFDFPQNCVREISFKYNGVGACPSSWAKEKEYDWKHMRSHTKAVVAALEHPMVLSESYEAPEPDKNASIDLLITYVNSSDRNWVQDYIKATNTHNPSKIRYRSWGTLKYLLRGVERYMPFIRNVVLIVSRASQIPTWINKENVRIVYHEDFIPKKYLPTFNSCAIESFFWNIPDLADRVIYFNDDMFPIFPMTEEDFFTGNTPHIKFIDLRTYSSKNMFDAQCNSGINLITKSLGISSIDPGKMFRPWHISTAITRQGFDYIRNTCVKDIEKTISRVRSSHNVNQYIYAYYYYYTNNYIDDSVSYTYFNLNEDTLNDIFNEILHGTHKMVCLNDSDKIMDYATTRAKLLAGFACKFPERSRFELP